MTDTPRESPEPQESLADFLRRVDAELAARRSDGSLATGVDQQFERNFALVRGDASIRLRTVHDALDQVSRVLESRFDPAVVSSRVPGGGVFHRVIGRLTRRHLSPAYDAIDACRLSLVALADVVGTVLDDRSEDVGSAFSSELLDRLAAIDSLEAEVAVLRARLGTLDTSHES